MKKFCYESWAGALFVVLLGMSAGTAWTAPPLNDDCVDALPVTLGVPVAGTTVEATDSGATLCAGTAGAGDVWYRYTPESDGMISFSLCGATFDSTLSILDACDGQILACNDDAAACGTTASRLDCFPATVGSTYFIRINGFDPDETGVFEFVVETDSCTPPPNDDCADALPIVENVPVSGDTLGATGSTASSCSPNDPFDVWYDYTPLSDGVVNAATCGSDFDTSLAVYDGCGGVELGCNDDSDCGRRSRVTDIAVTGGVTYKLRVSGYAGDRGHYTLGVYPVAAPAVTHITPASTGPTNASSMNFNVRFDQNVQGFNDAADLIFEEDGVSHTGVSVSGSNNNYTVTASGISGTGTMRLRISTASDIESLTTVPLSYSFTSAPVAFDMTPPEVVLSTDAENPVNAPITVQLDFSEVPVGFEETDIAPVNAIVSDLTGADTAYTFVLSPLADNPFSASIPAGLFTDVAGNASLESNTLARTYSADAPVPTLSTAAAALTNAPVAIEVDFSEASADFDADDIAAVNASVSAFTGGGESYSFLLTPAAEGTFSARVPAGVCSGGIGGLNVASNTLTFTYDATDPVFSAIAVTPSEAAADETVLIAFENSEPLAEDPEVTVNGRPAYRDNLKASHDYEYTYTVQANDPTGPALIEITGVDLAGNLGAASAPAAFTIVVPEQPMPLALWPAAALGLAAIVSLRRRS
jgi:hypothetical protein